MYSIYNNTVSVYVYIFFFFLYLPFLIFIVVLLQPHVHIKVHNKPSAGIALSVVKAIAVCHTR